MNLVQGKLAKLDGRPSGYLESFVLPPLQHVSPPLPV